MKIVDDDDFVSSRVLNIKVAFSLILPPGKRTGIPKGLDLRTLFEQLDLPKLAKRFKAEYAKDGHATIALDMTKRGVSFTRKLNEFEKKTRKARGRV